MPLRRAARSTASRNCRERKFDSTDAKCLPYERSHAFLDRKSRSSRTIGHQRAEAQATTFRAAVWIESESRSSGILRRPTTCPSPDTTQTATCSAFRSTPTAPRAGSEKTGHSGSSTVTESWTLPFGSSFTRHVMGSSNSTANSRMYSCVGVKRKPSSVRYFGPESFGSRSLREPPGRCFGADAREHPAGSLGGGNHVATSFPAALPCSPQNNACEPRLSRHSRIRPCRRRRRPPKHHRGRPFNSLSNRDNAVSAFRVATAFRRLLFGRRASFSRRFLSSSSRASSRWTASHAPSLQERAAA